MERSNTLWHKTIFSCLVLVLIDKLFQMMSFMFDCAL